MKVGGLTDKTLQPSLEVDSWDIKYDEDDNIFETEGKKTPMLEKQEVKYLGFVISGNARNVKNITARRNKSSNTLRNIKSMICGLGTYTVESGIIYFKSLLRSSLLYAAETYYNMTEQELRLIETKEEECLRKIIETGCKSPAAILYLEFGVWPARFQIRIMMLNFLHYILNQEKGSLLHRFFEAQLNNPTKGDWITHITYILKLLKIDSTFEEIRCMKIKYFMEIVCKKTEEVSFLYLLGKIKSKGKEIDYGKELKCQKYLLPNGTLTWEEQVAIFSYRSRMNSLKYNFGGEDMCVCSTVLNNEHLYSCETLNGEHFSSLEYQVIFNGTICQQKEVIQILNRNMKIFENNTLAQEDSP